MRDIEKYEPDSFPGERAENLLRLAEQSRRRNHWESTIRSAGDPAGGPGELQAVPADLLSERLDQLERTVNQLEWSDRQLRHELAQSQRDLRLALRNGRRWRAAVCVLLVLLAYVAAPMPSAPQGEAQMADLTPPVPSP